MYYVYRIYDKFDRLLYVGRSNDVRRRIEEHKATSDWMRRAYRFTTQEYRTLEEVMAAEMGAITSERPLFNGVGNRPLKYIKPRKKDAPTRSKSGDWEGGDYHPAPVLDGQRKDRRFTNYKGYKKF